MGVGKIIFVDLTSSCHTAHSVTRLPLAAADAGAVSTATRIHNSQGAEGYTEAFRLLKRHQPKCCGGLHICCNVIAKKNCSEILSERS